ALDLEAVWAKLPGQKAGEDPTQVAAHRSRGVDHARAAVGIEVMGGVQACLRFAVQALDGEERQHQRGLDLLDRRLVAKAVAIDSLRHDCSSGELEPLSRRNTRSRRALTKSPQIILQTGLL